MSATARFSDLVPRLLSGLVMAVVGVAAVWAGGLAFNLLVAALCGAMTWELSRMLDPDAAFGKAEAAGLSAAVALFVFATRLSGPLALAAVALAVALLAWRIGRHRWVYAGYLALILLAGLGLIVLRAQFGLAWVVWMVLVVIGSDLGGYFAGRLIGGPKLWPRVSPKKTWSGTLAGWVMALAIGWAMMAPLNAGAGVMLASVLVCMAGQAGDIAESAVKRLAGVKDSSTLIPGHGGVMDRFDAMIAAALMVLVLAELGLIGASVAR